MRKVLTSMLALGAVCALPIMADAAVSGKCDKCHTMHNSQNDSPMNIGGAATPNEILARGTCAGCHSGDQSKGRLGDDGTDAPRVWVTGSQGSLNDSSYAWLPGGYFDTTEAETDRHNVYDVEQNPDDLIGLAPPGYDGGANTDRPTNDSTWTRQLTCAGTYGCHGWSATASAPQINDSWTGINGYHHGNDSPFRYLRVSESHTPVRGTSAAWSTTPGPSDNVYSGCADCGDNNATISRLCGECHGDFHSYGDTTAGDGQTSDSYTGATNNNWLRHPTDLHMTSARFAARPTRDRWHEVTTSNQVPIGSNDSTQASAGDGYVICLSCHVAHGGGYADLLRWDYTQMSAGTNSTYAGQGCFVCHTTKDNDHQ